MLARLAAEIGVDVRGVSFHVGSQAPDSAKHVEAIEVCAGLLAQARREKLGTLDTLDNVFNKRPAAGLAYSSVLCMVNTNYSGRKIRRTPTSLR